MRNGLLTQEMLLAKGFLPRELPPCFSSVRLATALKSEGACSGQRQASARGPFALVGHSIPRLDGSRRVLGIPNPIGFVRLADALALEWPALSAFYARSWFSAASPFVHPSVNRALVTGFSPHARERAGASRACAEAWLLRADIERCAASVDHGALARAPAMLPQSRHSAQDGTLAYHVSNLQEGSTRGLPVGPDSSLALLEMLLTAVDLRLQTEFPSLHGLRRCDNYEFECVGEHEATAVRGALEAALLPCGLRLHAGKTEVLERRDVVTPEWVALLDALPLGPGKISHDAPEFVAGVAALVKAHPGEPVADRALGRTLTLGCDAREIPALRAVRMRIAAAAPAVLRFAMLSLRHQRECGVAMDLAWLEPELHAVIERHAPRGDGSEVAWALWAAVECGLKLGAECGRMIARIDDDIVALLALDADARGMVQGGLAASDWAAQLDEHALRGAHWLLAYEAAAHGWLGDASGVRAVKDDRDFGPLLRAGVRLFDPAPPTTAA